MNGKKYWGVALLIILLGVPTVLIIRHERAEIRQLKKELAESKLKKLLETGINQPTGINKSNTRPDPDIIRQNYENKPNDGSEYVWHGDHWHRVPDPDNPRLEDVDFSTVESSVDDFFKSDLPDELPDVLPTSAEIQQMTSWMDLDHLKQLLYNEAEALSKTDILESARLQNIGVEMGIRMQEIAAEERAEVMERHNAFVKTLPIEIPMNEDGTGGVIIEVGEYPEEGGKQ